jgi:heat shock protein HslJ
MRRRVLVSVIVVGVLAASACTRSDGDGGSAAGDPLDGRSFVSTRVLEGGAERSLVPGTRIELSFSDGRLSARAGCNLMGAGYRLEGGRLRLVGPIGMTEMGCDPERHDQDAWLSGFLGSSPRVELRGSRLVLSAGGTEIRLLDREVIEPDLPLEGTRWVLETIVRGEVASSVPAGLRAELRVSDGRIGGFNGCNEWGGRVVSTEGGVLVLRDVVQTGIGCSGAAAALEREVNAVVTAERIAYAIDGPLLVLRAGGVELHFRGGPAPSPSA